MKLINIYCLIFISLCAVSSTDAQRISEDDKTKMKRLADSIFNAGNWFEASIEYERCYFYAENPEERCKSLLLKANCLKQSGDFASAAKRLQESPVYNVSDSLSFQLQYQSALCYYLSGDFQTSSAKLKTMSYRFQKKEYLASIYLLYSMVFNELFLYDSAKNSSLYYISLIIDDPLLKDSLSRKITEFYSTKNLPHLKNARKAEWFSRIIPGLGQVYLGYPGEGAINFILNAGALGFGLWGVFSGYPITGYIIGAGLLQKFYYGGLNRTLFLTGKANIKNTREFNYSARSFILSL